MYRKVQVIGAKVVFRKFLFVDLSLYFDTLCFFIKLGENKFRSTYRLSRGIAL